MRWQHAIRQRFCESSQGREVGVSVKKVPGHDKRKRRDLCPWVGIVVHHTGIGGRKEISESLWKRLTKNITEYLAKKDDNYVSAHYVIGRHGEVAEVIDPGEFVAYHAGQSSFWHPQRREWVSGMNDHMIGIELIGDGNLHDYSAQQYLALGQLCRELIEKYDIHPNMIVGHEMISPKRKQDPGELFDWARLYNIIFRA